MELEELSVARVVARRRSRPGLSLVIAASMLVVLLAAGFGAWGGKPSASQAAAAAKGSGAGSAYPGPTTPGLEPGEAPAVTPWMPCSAPPAGVPAVLLELNGTPHPGYVEVLQTSGASIPSPTAIPFKDLQFISPNLPAELWIDGGACANAWTIKYANERLDMVGNAGLNPLRVAQNRFQLFLAPYGGSSGDLTAELVFQTVTIRATWPADVAPYERPSVVLWGGDGTGTEGVEGCDVSLMLRDGWQTMVNPCDTDLSSTTDAAQAVGPGEELVMNLGHGIDIAHHSIQQVWQPEEANLTCGTTDGQSFVADTRAGCLEGDLNQSGYGAGQIVVPAPSSVGRWTLAIRTCASLDDWLGSNQVCGTWFVNVEVTDSSEG